LVPRASGVPPAMAEVLTIAPTSTTAKELAHWSARLRMNPPFDL
jgi:hypothetical protein